MSEQEAKPKEWNVDWEVEVRVTIEATMTVSRSEIHEGITDEEAIASAREEMGVSIDSDDIDLSNLDPNDYEIEINEESFKVTEINEWRT